MMKRIVCMVPEGLAKPAMLQLSENYANIHILMHFARGIGRRKTTTFSGFGNQGERDVLEVIVPEAQADEVFEHLFQATNVYQQRGGIMYMHALMTSSAISVLPKPRQAAQA